MVSLTLDVMLTSTAMSSKPRRLCKGKEQPSEEQPLPTEQEQCVPLETPLVAVLPASPGHGWHCHQQHQPDLPLGVEGHPGVEVEVDANARQEPQGHPGERQLHDPQPAGTVRGHHEWALSPAPPHPGSTAHTKPLLQGWVSQRPFRPEMAEDTKFSQLFSSFIRSFALVASLLLVLLLGAGL